MLTCTYTYFCSLRSFSFFRFFFFFTEQDIKFMRTKTHFYLFIFLQYNSTLAQVLYRACSKHRGLHMSTPLFQALLRDTSVLSGSPWNPRTRWRWGDPLRYSTALSTASSLPRCTGRKMAFCLTWTIAGRSSPTARCSSTRSCTPNTTNPTRASTSAWPPSRTWAP